MHAINDVTGISKTLSYYDHPVSRKLIQVNEGVSDRTAFSEGMKYLKNALFPNTFSKVKHLFGQSLNALNSDEWSSYRNRRNSVDDVKKALSYQYRSAVLSFVRLSRSWNIEPVLMTQFNRFNLNDLQVRAAYERVPQSISYEDFIYLYKYANQITRDIAREEGVQLIDLEELVPSNADYIYDEVHLTEKGSQFVAEAVSKTLIMHYPSLFR